MARARGRAVRAVLAGTIACWAVAEGAAVAQEAAEVTEDLGNSYLLARRTTSLGSIIETVLFAGEPIVTEIVGRRPTVRALCRVMPLRDCRPASAPDLAVRGSAARSSTTISSFIVSARAHRSHMTFSVTVGNSGLSPKSARRSEPEDRQVEIRSLSSPLTIALSYT